MSTQIIPNGLALRLLRGHAYPRSLFYGRFHSGLARFEAHFTTLSGGDELLNGRYRVASTSGSAVRPGLVMQPWTIHPLPWEATECATC